MLLYVNKFRYYLQVLVLSSGVNSRLTLGIFV
nr:MAG TPA: hypothetical protein [Caudoviricetes sp.]